MDRKVLQSKLKDLSERLLSDLRSRSLSQVQKDFEEICSLHKNVEREGEHRDIRQARDQLKIQLRKSLGDGQYDELESEIAFHELQAEAVAFVKSTQEFLGRKPSDSELQEKIGVGLEIGDALKKLGLPIKALTEELNKSITEMLAHQFEKRLEVLLKQNEPGKALQLIDDFEEIAGKQICQSHFGEFRKRLKAKA